jgi:hypothetical protein
MTADRSIRRVIDRRRSDLQLPRHLPRGANNRACAGNLLTWLRFLKVTVQVGSEFFLLPKEVALRAGLDLARVC